VRLVSVADAFTGIALGFSQAMGGPYHAGIVHWYGEPITDDNGSISVPGVPVEKPCSVQIDAVTEAMQGQDGYTDRDVRLIILAPTLDGTLDTDARVEVLAGLEVPVDWVGFWSIQSVARDPLGIGWECRGRRSG
jgi:hypothetical protein